MSNPFGGVQAKAYFVEEANYGVTPDTPTVNSIGIVSDPTIMLDNKKLDHRGIGSRDLAALVQNVKRVNLTLPFETNSVAFLKNVTTLTSMSIEVLLQQGSTYLSLLFKGCIIDALSCKCQAEGKMEFQASLIGQNLVTAEAKQASVYVEMSGDPWTFKDSLVKYGFASPSIECSVINAYEWHIKNNLKGIPVIRSSDQTLIKHLVARHRELLGSMTFVLLDKSWIDAVNGTLAYKAWGFWMSADWVWFMVEFDDLSLSLKIEDWIPQTLSWRAWYLNQSW